MVRHHRFAEYDYNKYLRCEKKERISKKQITQINLLVALFSRGQQWAPKDNDTVFLVTDEIGGGGRKGGRGSE